MKPADIKALRLKLGMSQEQFGRALGIEGKYVIDQISRYERGAHVPLGPRVMRLVELRDEMAEKS